MSCDKGVGKKEVLELSERLFRILKEGEVYHREYGNHYQARDGISKFINYYNHRRSHQGIEFVTPYDKLTGQEEKILKE